MSNWVEELPEYLVLEDEDTAVGQCVVIEWRVFGKEPRAWLELTHVKRRKATSRCEFTIHGDEVLDPDVKRRFLDNQFPRLRWDEPFPTPVRVDLHRDYSVTIPNLKRRLINGSTDSEWVPTEVQIRDVRANPMMRVVPPNPRYKRGNDDAVSGPTDSEVLRATEESSYTRNPKNAVEPEEAERIVISLNQKERNMDIRSAKRADEAVAEKLERLVLERDAQKRRLAKTNSAISQRLIPAMIDKLNRQIADLQGKDTAKAA